MASIDLTLDGIQVPALSGYTPPFGTKKASGGLSTQEVNDNVLAPFVKQRPVVITEDSASGTVEYNASVVINHAGATFALGAGAFVGCEVCVLALTDGVLSYTGSVASASIGMGAGQRVKLVWDGSKWLNHIEPAKGHNIIRAIPKDITQYYTDGTLWKRIAGTDGFEVMEDIYAGDYFQMSKRAITANNPAGGTYAPGGADWIQGTQWVTVAGIDTLWGNGDTGLTYHHLVMVPGKGDDDTEAQHFGRSRMNSSNTTANGYYGSEMHTTVLGAVVTTDPTSAGNTDSINKQLRYEFGSHLKTTRELLTNAMTASLYNRYGSAGGAASGWAWYDCQAVLMSEVECYGSIVWSSSGYDTGNATHWLPAFMHSNIIRNNRTAYYWLKDLASSANFCFSYNTGIAGYISASYAGRFVRPRFVIA